MGALNIVFRLAAPYAYILLIWTTVLTAANLLIYTAGRLTAYPWEKKLFILVAIMNILEVIIGFVGLLAVASIYSQQWVYNYAFLQGAL